MKKFIAGLIAVAAIAFATGTPAFAERINKYHLSPSVVLNVGNAGVNDVTDATTGLTSTIDLSGGDYDKMGFAVYFASGAGTGTGTLTLQLSPDGGSTWLSTGYSQNITTAGANTAGGTIYANVPTGGATKARFTMALNGSTTFYNLKIWAMPSVD